MEGSGDWAGGEGPVSHLSRWLEAREAPEGGCRAKEEREARRTGWMERGDGGLAGQGEQGTPGHRCRLPALRAPRRGGSPLVRDGNLAGPGGGAGGGPGRGPRVGACRRQGWREAGEGEEAGEKGMGEGGLETPGKQDCCFFIVTNAQSESPPRRWGSAI